MKNSTWSKVLIPIALIVTSTISAAQPLDLSDKEKNEVRIENRKIAKQLCISFWTETDGKIKLLNDLGITLDDQCRCTEDSMSYLVSDDLAAYTSHGLYEMRTKGMENVDPMLKGKVDEYFRLNISAMRGCSDKLKKPR